MRPSAETSCRSGVSLYPVCRRTVINLDIANDHTVFYLQLFSKLHGVDPHFLNWTVRSISLTRRDTPDVETQIPVLNAGSLFGRMFPNFLADRYGPLNGSSFGTCAQRMSKLNVFVRA